MNNDQFVATMNDQFFRVEEVLAVFGTSEDRLDSFKQAASLQKLSPHDTLGGMMIKHTVSIYNMIGDNTGTHSIEKWDKEITDHIAYLVLLKAVIDEEELERVAALHPMIRTTVEPSGFHQNVTFGSDTPTELMTVANNPTTLN